MWMKHYKLNDNDQKLLNMSHEEFDRYMMENYSEMFPDRYAERGQKFILPMNFGFEIGKGWRHVLDGLCKKLKVIQEYFGAVCIFTQIKEKYGSARFYYNIKLLKEDSDLNKIIMDMIDVLVSHAEEYTDYVCAELGTNIDPEEKIHMGSWIYDMGLEGFSQYIKRKSPEHAEKQIESAKCYVEKSKKKHDITSRMFYLNSEELDEIQSMIENMIKSKIK